MKSYSCITTSPYPTTQPAIEQQINARLLPHCALCGSCGEPIYLEQQDRLFGADGIWSLTKCSNLKCCLIWMNPMPLAEDIGKAYANYYTHAAQDKKLSQTGVLKRVYQWMKRGYLKVGYGYQIEPRSKLTEILGMLLYLFPLSRSKVDLEVRGLRALPGGLLLDVGCGSGEWLSLMRKLGWQVEGLDFDENAVTVARLKGLQVRCGALDEQKYPDEFFDVITLNHVIEHVANPVETLVECRRILKKTGKFVLYTPNSASLGHLVFKHHWRGLEVPRHLHLFCPSSMKSLLTLAGFTEFSIRTDNSGYMWKHSFRLFKGEVESGLGIRLVTKVVPYVLTLLEYLVLVGKPEVGECLAVQAYKAHEIKKF